MQRTTQSSLIGLFGVPCTGKSTLHGKLLDSRSPGDKWTTDRDVIHRTTEEGRPPHIDDRWCPVIAYCHEVFSTAKLHFDDKSIRFILLHVLRAARADSAVTRQAVLLGEEVSARALSIGLRHPQGHEVAMRFVELLPPPAALVHLSGRPKVIDERLCKRRRILGIFEGLGRRERRQKIEFGLQLGRDIASFLAGRGVPVLELDAEGDRDEHAAEAMRFVRAVQAEFERRTPCADVWAVSPSSEIRVTRHD